MSSIEDKSPNSKEGKKKQNQIPHIYKIVLIGDSGVGKSSILLRFVDDTFSENFYVTLGVNYKFKNFTVDNKLVKLQIVSKK